MDCGDMSVLEGVVRLLAAALAIPFAIWLIGLLSCRDHRLTYLRRSAVPLALAVTAYLWFFVGVFFRTYLGRRNIDFEPDFWYPMTLFGFGGYLALSSVIAAVRGPLGRTRSSVLVVVGLACVLPAMIQGASLYNNSRLFREACCEREALSDLLHPAFHRRHPWIMPEDRDVLIYVRLNHERTGVHVEAHLNTQEDCDRLRALIAEGRRRVRVTSDTYVIGSGGHARPRSRPRHKKNSDHNKALHAIDGDAEA